MNGGAFAGRLGYTDRMIRFLVAVLSLLAFVTAPAAAQTRGPLVLAAASMQEAIGEAADAWSRSGHARPVLSFAASSALARQVAAGAPADLFVSADEEWMDDLARRGLLVPGTRAVLAGNRLVVVAQPGQRPVRGARGATLARLLGAGPLAMADPDSVPAGKYGRAALERLGAWALVAPRVVRAESVRAALAIVARGAAPYGIVYATDARVEPGVRLAGVFPANSHPPIVYPIARLTASQNPAAEGFRRFLLSRGGKAILRRHGFTAR
jgi:molybdate transport system substrate-binding protein